MSGKVVSKKLAIGLGALCIVFVVALVVSVFYYSSVLNSKDTEITSLSSQVETKNVEISSLNSQLTAKDTEVSNLNSQISAKNDEISGLNSQIDAKDSQISDLQSQLDDLNAANLVWSPFEVRINQGFFMISGFICNTGTETAHDVRLHVVAHAVNGTTIIDSYKEVGSINGKQIANVGGGLDIYYGGSLLGDWTITPEWS